MFDNILTVDEVSVAYGAKEIVHGISFNLRRGEILAVVGESGSGKSTILKAINGLGGIVTDGQIFFGEREITNLSMGERKKLAGESIGTIFQNAGASFCPVRKIGAQIFESVAAHKNWTYAEFLERAEIIMQNINLDAKILNEYPFRLSGGMAQRAGILAATILEPKLLLADEPTSALDTITQLNVVQELMKLRARQQISIVIVTHNIGVAVYMADKILVLRKGQQIEFGTKEQIYKAPRENYTRELIKAAA